MLLWCYCVWLFFFLMIRRPPISTRTDTLFPYTTLFRSADACGNAALAAAISHIWQLSIASPVFSRLEKHFVTTQVWQAAQQEHDRIDRKSTRLNSSH